MVDMMPLFYELMAMIIILATKPIFICKWALVFCLRTTFIVFHTWMELVKASTNFYVNMTCRTMNWIGALICLPIRVLTALKRESLLEQRLDEMQLELQTLEWDRKALEDHLHTAINEHKIMESILAELEDENDKALAKIEELESELQGLRSETLQLKEICGKGRWRFTVHETGNGGNMDTVAENYGIPYGIPPWKSSFKGSDSVIQDLTMNRDVWEGEIKNNTEVLNFLKTRFAASGTVHPFSPAVLPRYVEVNEVLDQRRGVALSQSLFSSLLSLLVGMIIWEAEDPCMPLVVALFTVVGISLKSVVQFFSTIKNKPASDAVALLSFNWFILGTLTYPTLPRVARMLAPLTLRLVDKAMSWFRVSSH